MPTSRKRVMLSLSPELEEKLLRVAEVERRPLASLCTFLISECLRLPKYANILNAPPETDDKEVVERMGLDKLTPERLHELQQLLQMLEKLKST